MKFIQGARSVSSGSYNLFRLGLLGFWILVACVGSWAAINRGSIRGNVTDPQGAVMPQVAVTITNTDTGVQTTGETNGAGFYLFSELVPGNYDVHFEAKGFIVSGVNKVVVKPDEASTVDVQLRLGATAQRIEVTATNPLVETSATNVGTAVAQRIVADLPILGRDTQSLVNLVPGVTSSIGPPGSLVGFGGGQFSGMPDLTHIMGSFVTANGAQPGGSEWYLDGNLNSMEGQDNMAVDPPPDALAEFQTVNTEFAAEYGRKEGAIFSQVLKSGTNRVHGDIYEYNRNNFFSARNPMTAPQPDGSVTPPNYANWNQFGGTIGAPIVIPHLYNGKNKSFVFAAWDLSLLHESGPWLGSIPTLKEHSGDFSDFPNVVQYGLYDPMSATLNAQGVFVRQPFLNPGGSMATSLPANRIDPVGSWIVNQFPNPNFLDPRQQNPAAGGCLNTCNNFEGTYGNSETEQSIVVKVDHEISNRDKLFVDWLFNPGSYRFLRYPWESATAPLVGFNGTYPYNVHNELATLGETHTFSPTMVNEFRFTYGRQFEEALPENATLTHEADMLSHIAGLNIPLFPPYQPVPSWYIGNGTAGSATGAYFGSPINNMVITGNNYTVLDNITKVWSKHTIKAGIMYRSDITGSVFPTESNMNFSHGLTQSDTHNNLGGNPYAQLMLGAVDQSTNQRYVESTIGSDHYAGIYAQDDYRITSKLTLNYGLRWDVFTWFNDRHNNYGMVDLHVPDPIDPARMGAIVYPGTSQHPSRRPFPANHNDFGPRFNFSYTPFANGKTVIRGGWDMIYVNDISYDLGPAVGANEAVGYTPSPSYVFYDATGHNYFNTQAVPSYTLSAGAPSLPNPLATNPRTTNAQWNGPGVAGYGGGFFSFVPYTHDPYTMIFNFQVQHQFSKDWMISVGYVGAQGRHITNQGGQPYDDRLSTAQRLQYKSTANAFVNTPADLVAVGWPATEPLSNTLHNYQQWEPFSLLSWPINNTSYNSLQVKVEKRFSHGFDFLAAYTNQKTIASAYVGAFCSNNWVGVSGWANGRGRMTALTFSGPQDPDNIRGDRTLANDDTPQILNTVFSYTLPFGPGRAFASGTTGVARHLVQGWKITGNFNTQSGLPLSVSGPGNNLTSRPNLIGNPTAGLSGKNRYQKEQQYFNPNAFQAVYGSNPATIALATSGTPAQQDAYQDPNGSYPFWRFGTAGLRLGDMRSPGFWNVDSSIGKDFIISEAQRFEFRVNAFNVFNHQNLGSPNTSWCLGPNGDGSTDAVHQFGCQFGRITSVQTDPRAWQFSLKFLF